MEKERKQKKALVTSRVLFYTVLDKIYVLLFAFTFIYGLIFGLVNKNKSIGGVLGYYALFIIEMVLIALLLNWIYKCVTKTMLCITEDEVYKEAYAPLKRSEMSIPLNKITSVTTFNFLWIFRSIIIFQYHQLPVVFFTWTNQEFKDKFDELVNKRKEEIVNEYEDKNMISFIDKKHYPIIGAVLGGLVVLFLIIAIIMSFMDPAAKVAGTYANDSGEVKLGKDKSCSVPGVENMTKCSWSYDDTSNIVTVNYSYEVKYLSVAKETDRTLTYTYSDKTLTNGSKVYTRK